MILQNNINTNSLFKWERNPYRRICTKCGANQSQFQTPYHYSKEDKRVWWEEVYQGDNPNCECKNYIEYHP